MLFAALTTFTAALRTPFAKSSKADASPLKNISGKNLSQDPSSLPLLNLNLHPPVHLPLHPPHPLPALSKLTMLKKNALKRPAHLAKLAAKPNNKANGLAAPSPALSAALITSTAALKTPSVKSSKADAFPRKKSSGKD
jgi:hypothetical protein